MSQVFLMNKHGFFTKKDGFFSVLLKRTGFLDLLKKARVF